jgi:PAS domain S-box-containing protein
MIQDALRDGGAVVTARDPFHAFADNLPQLAWIADRTGSTFWHNRRWHEYTGAGTAASRGWKWLQFVQPDHAERVETHLRRCVAAEEQWEDTFPLRGIGGKYQSFLSRAVPFRADSGEVVCWHGTHTDVSKRVGVENELRDAARRKDTLLAWLGHELRNPLAPIITSARLLTMVGQDDPALQAARDTIVRQALHLSHLIDNLLDAGRLSFGKLRLRKVRVELGPLIAQAVEGCRSDIERRHHRLNATLSEPRIFLKADPTRIVQMVSNLLSNAAKYMRSGGTVRVSAELEPGFAIVRVGDEGIGIAPELLSRVFDPYVQVGVGPLHTQGLGIGLALVKSIAEAHGGSVEARSEGLDCGSEFIVRLPLESMSPFGS